MNRRQTKLQLVTAMLDCLRDEDERELYAFPKLQFDGDDCTDFFADCFSAMHILYNHLTGSNSDKAEFMGVLIRLLVRDVDMNARGMSLDEEDDE